MEVLENLNIAIILPLIILQLILLIVALIDLVKNENTNGPKWVWVLVIVFINIVGPIVYFVIGRRNQ
ncbi:PLD nuclease N-terminal domain-containing protein [Neobacillus sp. LXY-4]|uniref:PLD nuclease N-terminal domain-containing protein n=1 Tax=Neobacillus sp. LXY-4 TaxID=3379826 RepID=UPI003EE16FD8